MQRTATSTLLIVFALSVLVSVRADDHVAEDASRQHDETSGKRASATTEIAMTPRLLEKRWHLRRDEARRAGKIDPKSAWGQYVEILATMLHNEATENEIDYLAEAVVRATDDQLTTNFRRAALEALVVVYARAGKRAALIDLVSRRCPDSIYHYNKIEFYLAAQNAKTLPDGILVLCEAYESSKAPETKAHIVRALRRGFLALGLQSQDDDALVRSCKAWYSANKDRVSADLRYSHNMLNPFQSYEDVGLFKVLDLHNGQD